MKKNTYLYVLMKSDSSMFKLGITTDLDTTIDYFNNIFKFRQDRSFVFEGEYHQVKQLLDILSALFANFRVDIDPKDGDFNNFFSIKALNKLNDFIEDLSSYKIKVYRHSLRKELSICKPASKILSREKKSILLFDFHELSKKSLEEKYSMSFERIEKFYNDFLEEIYKPHKKSFKNYLKMRQSLESTKNDLLKII
jgi:hypothetical protein